MHTFPVGIRVPILLATVVVVVVAAGARACTSDRPRPEPSPEPTAQYQRVPHNLCAYLRVDEVAQRFDLTVEPSYEPRTDYHPAPSWWAMGCSFGALGGGERFTTVLGDMDPYCWVSVKVLKASGDAPREYASAWSSFTSNRPEAAVTAIEGWWDEGISVVTVESIDQGTREEDPRASYVEVNYFIRHENLFLQASVGGWSPTSESEAAVDVLDDLMGAWLEETASHLTLTED